MTDTVLKVHALSKSFGGVRALRDLTFKLNSGEILGLIGPNGSGKSTTVNTLAGIFPPTSGQIVLGGTQVERLPEHARVAAGLARTFQTASLFTEFTVREQVLLGASATLKTHPAASLFGLGGHAAEASKVNTRVEEILALTGLDHLAEAEVGTISSAQQRFLMIATALASEPKVLLLDEPAAGLVAPERRILADMICAIRNRGTAVLVIEHHMALIMEICDRIVVLNFGEKIAQGTPAEIRVNKAVVDAYLGEAA